MHGDYVGVTFHKETAVVLRDGVFCQVEAVEFVTLIVNGRFGRIDVLTDILLLLCVQDASAKGYDTSRNGMHGEDDASVVAVKEFAVLRLDAESRFHQIFFSITALECRLRHSVAFGQAETQLEFLNDVVAKTTRTKISHTDGYALHIVVKRVGKIVARPLIGGKHCFALRRLLLLFLRLFLFSDLNAVTLCNPLQCLGVGHLFVLHDKAYGIATFATREALEELLRGAYDERGRLFVVERTQSLIVCASFLKRHKLLDNVVNISCRPNFIYGNPINHTCKISILL